MSTLHVIEDQGTSKGPLLWPRSVNGNTREGLKVLQRTDSPEEIHARVAGYWRLGLNGDASRGQQIRQALQRGRRVFVVGYSVGVVVATVEVSLKPHLPPQMTEKRPAYSFTQVQPQPGALTWPNEPNDRWATQFDGGPTQSPIRVRLHTATVDDADWAGRQLVGDWTGAQNPGLYTTEAAPPPRLPTKP